MPEKRSQTGERPSRHVVEIRPRRRPPNNFSRSRFAHPDPSRSLPHAFSVARFNRLGRHWPALRSLRGDFSSRSNDREIDEARRLQSAQPMSHSSGDEDFEFLRNLLQEVEASPAAAAFPNVRRTTSFPSAASKVSSPWIPVQKHSRTVSPHPGIVTTGAGSAIQAPRVSSSNFVTGDAAALHELVEESKLRAADEVAACIWLAGDKVRGSLFTRVTDTWEVMEDEVPLIGAFGINFSEVVAGRLEATSLAVEAGMRVAEEVTAARCDMALVEPGWRGSNILRGDVLTRLEAFRIYNIREVLAGEPGFSPAEFRQDLVQRLRATREAVVDRINYIRRTAATVAGVHGLQFWPAISEDEALLGIDYVAQCVLQKLKVTYLAAEELRYPTGRVRLLEQKHEAQAAVAKKLPEVHVHSESGSSTDSVTSADNSAGIAASSLRLPRDDSASKKKKKRPGSGSRRCKNEECCLHPHFGFTRPEYCSRHKLPGMFNVKGRRCVYPECARTPVYGKNGDPHPTYCAAHKLDNMMDIKNPTCRERSCNRQPSFGLPQDRRATYCASHMLEGMVNVRRMLAAKSLSRRSWRERSSAADAEVHC